MLRSTSRAARWAQMARVSRSVVAGRHATVAGRQLPSVSAVHRSPVTPRREMSSWTDSSFLNGTNSAYIDEMYLQWRENPANVHASWNAYFATNQYTPPPNLVADYEASGKVTVAATGTSSNVDPDLFKIVQLVRIFQVRGHLMSDLDPLKLMPHRKNHDELTLEYHGLSESDLDKTYDLSQIGHVKGFLDNERGVITLRKLYERLLETYCGKIGVEYMHIPDVDKCNWIRDQLETRDQRKLNRAEKLQVLDRLTWADHFETFCANKYNTAKRFGLEGGESTIAGMKAMVGKGAELGVNSIVMGMPHRGRLNVLSTVIRKPMEQIFCEFHGGGEREEIEGSGDVKYHLGMSLDRPAGKNNSPMHLSLLANPSHLEAVNTVVCGKTRAKQFYAGDTDRKQIMGVLLHGDAAFSGQGIVFETMGLGDLVDYTTGGTIHIVVNNQIGFTTDPQKSRSSPYCTDVAKTVNAPIFHVNGDDPEAVCLVFELAVEWRQKFGKDVVIDLVCYRKHGHNEIDEPSFTQPAMYRTIGKKPSTLALYQQQLIQEGIPEAEIQKISDTVNDFLQEKYDQSKSYKIKANDWLATNWQGFKGQRDFSPVQRTGVSVDTLRAIGEKLVTFPDDFKLHRRLKGVFNKRKESIESGEGLDWATAEALAFGSLLTEGKHVRLSGQDVERGTFSHRHAVVHDQDEGPGKTYTPLQNITDKQSAFSVSNSNLSEFGVLGFELGYSLENPSSLVLWEAQFGDFVNGAQIIIDQFLSSGEDKWLRQSGLVMLLPHGYEGQGPEHSSARLERFLQNSNDHPDVIPETKDGRQIQQSNWQVCNITTPANYFHVLRRQLYREFRKPLIIMSPKSLLRHPQCRSSLEEMKPGCKFQRFIPEEDTAITEKPEDIKRIIYCSGKVYYDLLAERTKRGQTDVAIGRVEQISPFPFNRVGEEAAKYPNAEIVWVQEEPMNMGAWTYAQPRIVTAVNHYTDKGYIRPKYVGRPPSASTAAGSGELHNAELQNFLNEAFDGLQ